MQEQRSISAPLSRRRRQQQRKTTSSSSLPCCYRLPLLIIMLTPLAIILALIFVLSTINDANNSNALSDSSPPPLTEEDAAISTTKHNVNNNNLRAKINNNNAVTASTSDMNMHKHDTLILHTSYGDIHITLRPDLSKGSITYIKNIIHVGCKRCNLYRAEKAGILQGVMGNKDVPTNTEFGVCPPDAQNVKNNCPKWDLNCSCHGPVMTRGSVGWAAGTSGGPDFFFDYYKRPATHWGTQHTNWGFVDSQESLQIIETILNEPTKNNGGLHMLIDKVPFKMEIV